MGFFSNLLKSGQQAVAASRPAWRRFPPNTTG
ncbi:hypothetical protein Mnod_2206 [Methylobacterium nodulans ORS 2060]|uniref:Uncharacterized protein n=1 Tax=Methylobacterium nodulans (strain LMG 21967 / CNCM I-2342 / ORS 2060) TaxID=460265 RepID=B8I9W0_METNO|nr:hypothetical protein Mnod_2206 [Methylobacterium nodulans ORS 2060]